MDRCYTYFLALFLCFFLLGNVSSQTTDWDTAFTWNLYHPGGSGYTRGGEATIQGTTYIAGDGHIKGTITMTRCSGDPAVWAQFSKKDFWILPPTTEAFSGFYGHRITSDPVVTPQTITLTIDEPYLGNLNLIQGGSWRMRLNLLFMEPYVVGCSTCNIRFLSSASSIPLTDCAWEGPDVTNLVAMPANLLSDQLEDVDVSCRVTDDVSVTHVSGLVIMPDRGSASIPMPRVSGNDQDGGYAVAIDAGTWNDWLISHGAGDYIFKVYATDSDANLNNWVFTVIKVTAAPTCQGMWITMDDNNKGQTPKEICEANAFNKASIGRHCAGHVELLPLSYPGCATEPYESCIDVFPCNQGQNEEWQEICCGDAVVTTTTTTTSTTSTTLVANYDCVDVPFHFFIVGDQAVSNCELWGNMSGSWALHALFPMDGQISENMMVVPCIPNGTYEWNVQCLVDDNMTWIEEENWLFHVCSGCEKCHDQCLGESWDYGACRSGQCLASETQTGGLCGQGMTCCCGMKPTTTTILPPVTTTTQPVFPCGDGVVQAGEDCDPPGTHCPTDGCAPAMTNMCPVDAPWCWSDCSCNDVDPATVVTTTSTTTTTLQGQTTSTTLTTTSTTQPGPSTTTTTTVTTTTIVPAASGSWAGDVHWRDSTGQTSNGGVMRINGDVGIDEEGNIALQMTMNRCSGDAGLWASFVPAYMYLQVPTSESQVGKLGVKISAAPAITADTITLQWSGKYNYDMDKINGPLELRFNQLFTSPEAIPGCANCPNPMFLTASNYQSLGECTA